MDGTIFPAIILWYWLMSAVTLAFQTFGPYVPSDVAIMRALVWPYWLITGKPR